MMSRTTSIVPLSEMTDGQEADVFVLLTSKEEATTRDGRPFFKVTFRDARREVSFPIWGESPWSDPCREEWSIGEFFKMRAVYRESNYGPQLDIRKIRQVSEADKKDGFDETMCQARTRFDTHQLMDELLAIVNDEIEDKELGGLVVDILQTNRECLLTLPAATRNHHSFVGGYLEHVVSVTRTCLYLADKYCEHYGDLEPPLSKDLIVAGAVLHDIGKVRELESRPEGPVYTAEGELVGHVLQGRDMVREAAAGRPLDPETLLRLEHLIIAHQRLPEWGSPKPPMTPEALVVHYADDLDAKLQMMYAALRDDSTTGPFTSRSNPLRQKIFRGSV